MERKSTIYVQRMVYTQTHMNFIASFSRVPFVYSSDSNGSKVFFSRKKTLFPTITKRKRLKLINFDETKQINHQIFVENFDIKPCQYFIIYLLYSNRIESLTYLIAIEAMKTRSKNSNENSP